MLKGVVFCDSKDGERGDDDDEADHDVVAGEEGLDLVLGERERRGVELTRFPTVFHFVWKIYV